MVSDAAEQAKMHVQSETVIKSVDEVLAIRLYEEASARVQRRRTSFKSPLW
jgi:hypothetical protein